MRLCSAMLLALMLAAASSGCGGSSSAADPGANRPRLYPWLKGPSREFLIPGGDNAVQTFGREATLAEREQASHLIHAWMRARATEDWKADCGYLTKQDAKLLTIDARGISKGRVRTCPEALAFFGHKASGRSYRNNLSGPIDSLRVGEGHGYAQYHGREGKDWVIAVARENGSWKVSTPAPLDRNR